MMATRRIKHRTGARGSAWWKIPHMGGCTGKMLSSGSCTNPQCSYKGEEGWIDRPSTTDEDIQRFQQHWERCCSGSFFDDEEPEEKETDWEFLLQRLRDTNTDAYHGCGKLEVLEAKVEKLEELVIALVERIKE